MNRQQRFGLALAGAVFLLAVLADIIGQIAGL